MKLLCLIFAGAMASLAIAGSDQLVVHEWGTFTCLHDETGTSVEGINTDEEPLPAFTHNLPERQRSFQPNPASKGIALNMPEITMRLETPVIYFYPPQGATAPLEMNVKVKFHGGWLTQFYPLAEAGFEANSAGLRNSSVGAIAWNGLKVGVNDPIPQTDARVWTAPRGVKSAIVSARAGAGVESEKYFFYRGVGHLNAPVRVRRNAGDLLVTSQLEADVAPELRIEKLWLVESRSDGACAFRPLNGITVPAGREKLCVKTADYFNEPDFAAENLAKLRQDLHAAMVADGLFADEADALLNTWEVSYFKAPGQRLFFLVPRAWTDKVLPLEISTPCALSRTMVGRIELVTLAHRSALLAMKACPAPARPLPVSVNLANSPVTDDPLSRAFYSLGRFRNALVRLEAKATGSKTIKEFARLNQLQ